MENSFLYILQSNYVPLAANIGILSLTAWFSGFFGLTNTRPRNQFMPSTGVKTGFIFGLSTIFFMFLPVTLAPGVFIDGRGAPLLFAGLLGGPVGGGIAALMAATVRGVIGGSGALPGVFYILIIVGVGIAWRGWRVRRGRDTAVFEFALLGLFASAITTPLVFLLPEEMIVPVLLSIWPKMVVLTLCGVLFMGVVIRRDVQMFRLMDHLEREKTGADKLRQMAEISRRQAERGARQAAAQLAEAEHARRAKSNFLRNVSHELRTPLNAILGFSDIMKQDGLKLGLPERYRGYSDNIWTSGQHLLSLLNDLLDLSKIEAGKMDIDIRPVRAADAWELPVKTLKVLAEERGISLRLSAAHEDAVCLADKRALEQALVNVVGNAIKFSPDRGNVICRTEERTEKDGHWLVFIVQDFGSGIPKEDIPRLLEPFERGQSTQPEPLIPGTGLGLTITNSLVSSMGGQLEIETVVDPSDANQGTTIRLILPAHQPVLRSAKTEMSVPSL